MIQFQEHFYDDDPRQGHPDVRTRLKDASYFFLGNGLIQAAVQYAPSGEGTPIGLLIMDPETFGKKREALSFDPRTGLEKTMIRLRGGSSSSHLRTKDLTAEWDREAGIPTVQVRWEANDLRVREIFYCPNRSEAELIRRLHFENKGKATVELELETGLPKKIIRKTFTLDPGEEVIFFLSYRLTGGRHSVHVDVVPSVDRDREAQHYWENIAKVAFGAPLLDHYFNASCCQLPAVMSRSGKVDASIWQYNREWVRDHSFMALGLTLSGHHHVAKTVFERLLEDFVTDEGDCIDSSERRDPEEAELDQNGTLLWALRHYVLWTSDLDIISKYWEKIKVAAEYPLKDTFRHRKSGLFSNCRDYWERHRAHGIEPGLELSYQVLPAIGLAAAAELGRMLSREPEAERWAGEAKRLKQAILHHPEFALVNKRGFIKRRNIDGSVVETIQPTAEVHLAEVIPLMGAGDHFLNPDTSAALPIAMGFVSPQSDLAKATMKSLETLWNQDWDGGGYGRYHFSSEPDSPGPWPFPSLFVARAYAEMGDYDKVWRILNWLNTVPGSAAGSWFEFYGPRIAPPYPQVGITPWTWAEMITLLVHHVLGIQVEADFIRLRPRLLPGLERVAGDFPIRDHRLHLDLKVNAEVRSLAFKTNTDILKSPECEIHLPYPQRDIYVEAVIPPP